MPRPSSRRRSGSVARRRRRRRRACRCVPRVGRWVDGRGADADRVRRRVPRARRARCACRAATLHATVVRGYAFLGRGPRRRDRDRPRGVSSSESFGETWERGIAYQLLAGREPRARRSRRRGDIRTGVRRVSSATSTTGSARTHHRPVRRDRDAARSPQRTATLLGGSEAIFQSIPSALIEPFRDAHGSGRGAPAGARGSASSGVRRRAWR